MTEDDNNPSKKIKDLLQLGKLPKEPGHHQHCVYPNHVCICEALYQQEADERETDKIRRLEEARLQRKKEKIESFLDKFKF